MSIPRMDAEWTNLAQSRHAEQALARWSRAEPELAPFADLQALRACVHDRANPGHSDRILAALVRLAATTGHNDLLATRVVLQLLLPGAIRLAANLSWLGDRHTVDALVLGELTTQIRTYPWRRRPHRIAANLLLDTRQQLTRAQHRTRREVPDGLEPGPWQQDKPTASDEQYEARIAAIEMLRHAHRSGVLTKDETRVLVGLYVCDLSADQLAAATGRSRSTVYVIRQRATVKLRRANGGRGVNNTRARRHNDI